MSSAPVCANSGERSRSLRVTEQFGPAHDHHGQVVEVVGPPCRARDHSALRLRIRELAHARPRFGYLRIWVLLRREGWGVNRKRVRRLYRLDGLQLRMRVRRRKHMALHRGPAPVPTGPTERWSMDFVHDALADGRPFRVLTVVDQWSRSSPVLEVASRMSGSTVGEALDRVLEDAPRPRSITVDHVLSARGWSRAGAQHGPGGTGCRSASWPRRTQPAQWSSALKKNPAAHNQHRVRASERPALIVLNTA